MEIKNTLGGLNPYERARIETSESETVRPRRESGHVAENAPRGDRVQFSDEAMLRTEAYKAASNAPDVRRDRVEEIKARVAAGTYEMDSRKIAERLVKDDIEFPG